MSADRHLTAICLLALMGLCRSGFAEESLAAPAVQDGEKEAKKSSGIADLKHLGSVRMPPWGKGQYGPNYPNFYQVMTPVPETANRLYVTWKRAVGIIELPEPAKGNPAEAPEASWVTTPVKVGDAFEAAVVKTGSMAHWAELRGIAYHQGKIWLNYGKYYHVDPASYANLNSIDANLDAESETKLHDIFTIQGLRPIVKNHAGFLAAIPEGWHPRCEFLRGNFWQNGEDGGPRLQAVDIDGRDPSQLFYVWALIYDQQHPVGKDWSTFDSWTSVVFLEKGERKYIGITVRKGTAPGWYGGKESSNGIVDKCSEAQGRHAYPYTPQLWLFRWDDILAVMNETKRPWEPKPVQKILMPEFANECSRVSGATFLGDKLWVLEEYAVSATPASYDPRVNALHCYEISGVKNASQAAE